MRLLIVFGLCILSWNINAKVFYQTGYEAENEPFGNWKVINRIKRGAVTSISAFSGKSSRTTGLGSGRYGGSFAHNFKPELKADKIWLSYRMYGEKVKNYLGFIFVHGKTDNGSNSLAVYMSINNLYVSVIMPKKTIKTKALIKAWHKYEYELNFKRQSLNFYIDGKLKLKNVPFYSAEKNLGKINGINRIVLGGSGAKDKTVFYDDFYVGTDRFADMKSIKMKKITDKINPTPYLRIGKTVVAPVIDGKLDDKCWQYAATFSPLVHPSGSGRSLQTNAFINYDAENIYIGIRAYDPHLDPALNMLEKIKRGKPGTDIATWSDDGIELFVVTKPDAASDYFHLGFNLAGGTYDSHPTKGIKWSTGMKFVTKYYDKFWIMEIKIPLKGLDVSSPLVNKQWRFNLCRNKKAGKKYACWSPTFGSFHTYSNFGVIEFATKGIKVFHKNSNSFASGEGSNKLQFGINSPQKQTLTFRNIISYKNADSVANVETVSTKATEELVFNDKYFIFTNTPERLSSDSISFIYEVRDAQNKLVCRSAPYITKLERYTPLQSSFICTTSNVIFKYFSNLFINRGASRSMLLLLQADKKLLPKIKYLNFQIEMPEYIKLAPLNSSDISSCRPTEIQEKFVTREGSKYRLVNMKIDRKWLYSTAPMGIKQGYNKWTVLTFECSDNAPLASDKLITYKSSAIINGKTVIEKVRSLCLNTLPGINGRKAPEHFPFILYRQGRVFENMSQQERGKFISNAVKSGCCFMNLDKQHSPDSLAEQFYKQGMKFYQDIPTNAAPVSWRSNAFPGAVEFLKKNPQYQAMALNGKTCPSSICLTILSQNNSPYNAEMQKWISPLAQSSGALMWDYEVPGSRSGSLCFCSRCMRKFAKFIEIDSISPQQAVKKYNEKWIDFHARRVALISKKLYKCTKRANPDCQFWVYSAYLSKTNINTYSVDWRYYRGALDNAICGYGRPLQGIKNTIKAITPHKLTTGLLMLKWWNTSYSYSTLRNSIFRRITDSNGGVLLYCDMQLDGRLWLAIADASRLVDANKSFFLNHQRDDKLCSLIGTSGKNLAVLRNKANERLIFIFNPSGKAKTCTVKNFKVPTNSKLKDFYTGKTFKSNQKATIKIPGLDVKVLVLK